MKRKLMLKNPERRITYLRAGRFGRMCEARKYRALLCNGVAQAFPVALIEQQRARRAEGIQAHANEVIRRAQAAFHQAFESGSPNDCDCAKSE